MKKKAVTPSKMQLLADFFSPLKLRAWLPAAHEVLSFPACSCFFLQKIQTLVSIFELVNVQGGGFEAGGVNKRRKVQSASPSMALTVMVRQRTFIMSAERLAIATVRRGIKGMSLLTG